MTVTLELVQRFDAPAQAVWDLMTDTSAWPRWAGVRSVQVDRPGDEARGGAGQLRTIKTWSGTVQEEVTAVEPGLWFSYSLLSGAPVHDYRGTVSLEPDAGGTKVTWNVEFLPRRFWGPALRVAVSRMMRRAMRGLAAEL
ncbi:MAG TPA: SRPBCC family protein [Nocardioidaceae bacterium]|nr:SRPBCC family protein [Nocardioidaceae bacterium]